MIKARIENGRVVEVLDSGDQPFPPFSPELIWVECPAGTVEGDVYDGTNFSHYVAPPPTTEQLIAAAVAEKAARMAQANYQISLLIDLTDSGIVDDPDPANVALLKLWKKYRIALLAIVTTNVPVTWPVTPAAVPGSNSQTPSAE